jgi:hypothetical protein
VQIRTKDLYGDCQEDDPEELADRDHSRGAEDPPDHVHGPQNDKNEQQVEQDAQQDHRCVIVGFQGHDRRQGPRTGDEWKGDWDHHTGLGIRFAFEELDTQHHFQPQDKDHDGPADRERSLVDAQNFQELLAPKKEKDHQRAGDQGCFSFMQRADLFLQCGQQGDAADNVDDGEQGEADRQELVQIEIHCEKVRN